MSGILSGSLDIHAKRSDHWRQYPGNENRVQIHSILESRLKGIGGFSQSRPSHLLYSLGIIDI